MSYYCTIEYVKTLLPTNLTIGTSTQTQPTLQVTNGRESITETRAKELIALAGQMIDSRLSPVYLTPLKRTKQFETLLKSKSTSGTNVIYVRDGSQFSVGCEVRLSCRKGSESYTVTKLYDDVPNLSRIEVTPNLTRTYVPSDGWIVGLVDYPAPVPLICARLTVSMIIDRIFVSEQSADTSKYGEIQKNLAATELDNVLQGIVRLHGQEHQGQRFARSSIRNAVSTPASNFQPGGMK
jgi:hypothetical protein